MKKFMSKLMVGAVVLSVLAPSASYAGYTVASANTNTQQTQQKENKQAMKQMTEEEREAKHEKLMEIIKKYTPELADQFQAFFDEQEVMKAKIDEIRDQVKAGTLTVEEAQEKLKELGLEGGSGFGKKGFDGKELDEETKAKIDEIREQVKAGTLTKEEAQEKLKELGLEGGHGFGGHGPRNGNNNHLAQLEEAVANNDEAKVKEILTQLLADLQARNESNH